MDVAILFIAGLSVQVPKGVYVQKNDLAKSLRSAKYEFIDGKFFY